MKVVVPNAESLRIVSNAVAKEDTRSYLEWICLDIEAGCVVGVDGHILARADVRIEPEDATALHAKLKQHAQYGSREVSFLFRLASKMPKRWDGVEITLDFATMTVAPTFPSLRDVPILLLLAPAVTCQARFPDWQRVDVHKKAGFALNPHFEGSIGLDVSILSRVFNGIVRIDIEDETMGFRVSTQDNLAYITLMPVRL